MEVKVSGDTKTMKRTSLALKYKGCTEMVKTGVDMDLEISPWIRNPYQLIT
jgi:hypothetical protein